MKYTVRLGQAAYFGGDYSTAIEQLTPMAENKTVLADPLPQGAQVLIVAQGGDLFQIDPVTGSPTTVLRPK